MGVSSAFFLVSDMAAFVAAAAEGTDYDVVPESSRIRFKGWTMTEVEALCRLLTGADDVVREFGLIAEVEGAAWFQSVPTGLSSRIAALTDEEIAAIAPKLHAATPDLDWNVDELTALLAKLQEMASRRAVDETWVFESSL